MLLIGFLVILVVGLGLVAYLYNTSKHELENDPHQDSDFSITEAVNPESFKQVLKDVAEEGEALKKNRKPHDPKKAFLDVFKRFLPKKKDEEVHLHDLEDSRPIELEELSDAPNPISPLEDPFLAHAANNQSDQEENLQKLSVAEPVSSFEGPSEVDVLKEKIKTLESMLDEKSQNIEDSQKSLVNEKEHREEFSRMQEMLQEKIQALKEKNSSLKEEVAKAQEENQLYQNKIDELTVKLEGSNPPSDEEALKIAEEKIEEQLKEKPAADEAKSKGVDEPDDDMVIDNPQKDPVDLPTADEAAKIEDVDLTEDQEQASLKDVFQQNQDVCQDDSKSIEVSEDDLSK